MKIQDDEKMDFSFFDDIQQSTYDTFETIFGIMLYDLGVTSAGSAGLEALYSTSKLQTQYRALDKTWFICVELIFCLAYSRRIYSACHCYERR